MNQRALDLAVLCRGQLASLGPAARSLNVTEMTSWLLIRIGMATDDALRALAVDLGLVQARTERRGRLWWRQVESRQDGLVVVTAGPYHEGPVPGGEGKP